MQWLKQTVKNRLEKRGRTVISTYLADQARLYIHAAESSGDIPACIFHGIIRTANCRTFVQIGANDGDRDDRLNTFIRDYNLSGILVEPQPAPFERLQQKYAGQPNIHCENVAIAAQPGNLTLYKFDGDTEGPIQLDVFTSLDLNRITRAKSEFHIRAPITPITVPAITFDDLMRRHHMQSFDILVVDTEGYDAEILKQINLVRWRPAIIQFEHVHLSASDTRACYDALTAAGYSLFRGWCDSYALRSLPPEPAHA